MHVFYTSYFQLQSDNSSQNVLYSYGEQAIFKLTTLDQFNNSREGVFVVEAPTTTEVSFIIEYCIYK